MVDGGSINPAATTDLFNPIPLSKTLSLSWLQVTNTL